VQNSSVASSIFTDDGKSETDTDDDEQKPKPAEETAPATSGRKRKTSVDELEARCRYYISTVSAE
jgi:hypothetical protein